MKALAAVFAGFAGVLALLLVSAFLLPRSYRVERSVVLNAPPAAVFPWVNTLRTWPAWTAWTTNRFPDMQLAFEGPESGPGARYRWRGQSSGTGMLRLTAAEPNRRVGYELDFADGKYVSAGTLTLEPVGTGVRVRWTNEGDLGRNPFNRWFGLLMMDRLMGGDFQTGLEQLKAKVEAAAQ